MFPPDFKELLSIFNNRKIRYLPIGGYAVSLHAQSRATKDLDLLVSPDAGNDRVHYAALAEFGAPLAGLKAADFMEPDMFFRTGAPPLMVDFLQAISGVDFESAELAAGRPQDLVDVACAARQQTARANVQENTDGEELEN